MQTSLRNHSKFILKLPELKRKWNNFSNGNNFLTITINRLVFLTEEIIK